MTQPSNKRFVIEDRVDSLVASKVRDPASTTRLELQPIVKAQADSSATAALANNSTVAAAAAQAVNGKLNEAGLVYGGGNLNAQPELFISFVDQNGRRSFLEALASDGTPSPEAAKLIDKALARLTSSALPLPLPFTEGSGLSFVLVDKDGRKSELQVGTDGKLTGPFVDRVIAAATAAGQTAAATAVQASRVPLVGWGDSMTAANWIATTAAQLGVAYKQLGIGGQRSENIAARQNGTPALVTLPSNTLPASGSVTLTSISTVVYSSSAGTGLSSGKGYINGVLGTLTRDNTNNVHTFTRDVAGTAVWVAPNTPFMAQDGIDTRANISILWCGRNGFKDTAPETIVAYIKSMVDYLTASDKRFLILEVAPWATETMPAAAGSDREKLNTLNTLLKATWPRDFVPQMTYLRTDEAFAAAGIAKTAQDITDISNQITPISFRADDGHLNTVGNNTLATFITNVIRQKGWSLT